jgi:hypothetical protein
MNSRGEVDMKRVVLLALLLSACAAPQESKYEQSLRAYVGQPVDKIMMRLGAPAHKQTNSDGSAVMTWDTRRVITGLYNNQVFECSRSFNVSTDGIVTGYSTRGNGCNSR